MSEVFRPEGAPPQPREDYKDLVARRRAETAEIAHRGPPRPLTIERSSGDPLSAIVQGGKRVDQLEARIAGLEAGQRELVAQLDTVLEVVEKLLD